MQFSAIALTVVFVAAVLSAHEARAQSVPVTPQQLVRSLPAPLPVEVRPFSTGASDPHAPLSQIKSPTQLSCIKRQLSELQKVADAAGGNESLQRQMAKIPVVFEILNNDTTSGKPSLLQHGLSRGMEPEREIWLLTNFTFIDSKTHQVECEFIPAGKIIEWLERDINHPIRFTAGVSRIRGSGRASH